MPEYALPPLTGLVIGESEVAVPPVPMPVARSHEPPEYKVKLTVPPGIEL